LHKPAFDFWGPGIELKRAAWLFRGESGVQKPAPWSWGPNRYSTSQWKGWTVWDKNPEPAPACNPDLGRTPPARPPLSRWIRDERTSDREPGTACDDTAGSMQNTDRKIAGRRHGRASPFW